MEVIDNLRARAEQLQNGLSSGTIVRNIIKENEAYIVDMNSEEQLYEQGVNRLGVSIADYAPYSPLTIAIKKSKGQPTNRVTLCDEGDFHASFYIEADNTRFEIKAHDEKTEWLIKKYGRQILGLTDEHIADLIKYYILPDIKEQTKRILYGY